MPNPPKTHASDSAVQRSAEREILTAVAREFGVEFSGRPQIDRRVDLDGFADGPVPVCVEVWAHQGPAKSGQTGKVMRDFCKLLLVERLLGRPCRKVFAVCEAASIAFLKNSWQGHFADEFNIERHVVELPDEIRKLILAAQARQFR